MSNSGTLPKQPLVSIGIAVVAGMVMARLLPFIYAPVMGTVLNLLGIDTDTRDSLNIFLMTAITFLTSFVITFLASGGGRRA